MKKLGLIVCAVLALSGCDRFRSAESRVERAHEYVEKGDPRAAIVELMNALKKEPDSTPARMLLAETVLWLGDPGGAQRELDRSKAPRDARRVLLEARIANQSGRSADAVKLLNEPGLTFAPGQRELELGRAYLRLGQAPEAQRSFEAAAAADGKLAAARAGIFDARALGGDERGALAGLEQLTRDEPGSAPAWFSLGLIRVTSGDIPGAAAALAQADKLSATQLDYLQRATLLAMLAETQLLESKLDAARATQQSLARLAPDALGSRYVAARIAMASNDYTAAVDQLRKILSSSPDLQQARLMLGMAFVAQGNLEQASRELTELVGRAPDNVQARQLLAQVRMRLDDPDGALRMLVPTLGGGGAPEVNALIDAARSQLGAAQSVSLLEQMLEKEPDNDSVRTQLAAAYLQAGTPAKAIELLRKGGDSPDASRAAVLVSAIGATQGSPAARSQVDALIAAHPGETRLAQLAATFYLRQRDSGAARRTLTNAIAKGGEPKVLLLALAQVEWAARNRAAASAALAQLLERDPGNTAGHMAAGEVALAGNDLPAARSHFESVRKARPESLDARLKLAQVALAQADPKAADVILDEALTLAPKNAAIRNQAGILNLNYGRADRALAMFRTAVELDAESPIGWFNLARTQRTLGQAGAARDSLQKALAKDPNWLPAIAGLVALDIEAHQPEQALARVAALEKAEPGNAAARVLEGDVYAAVQRYAEAATAYGKAYELTPQVAIALKDFRVRTTGNLPNTAQLLERWSAAHPDDVEARSALADAALRRKDFAKAAEQYRALLALRPNDVVTMNNLAWVYQQTGDKRALPLAREAVKLAPRSAAINDTLGWMLVEGGSPAEGLPFLAVAAAAADATPDIRFHHAVALARTGSIPEARRTLETLLRAPNFEARSAAETLLRQLSNGPSAGG